MTSTPQVPAGSASFGSVPAMNHSLTALRVLAFARNPLKGSILTWTRPSFGRSKLVTGHFADASWRKPCQTKVDTSIEKRGRLAVETRLLSELPFHTPTASA